jgi:hypothetical protein
MGFASLNPALPVARWRHPLGRSRRRANQPISVFSAAARLTRRSGLGSGKARRRPDLLLGQNVLIA